MKKIICLWGGPGTGKSTTSALLFGRLKQLGFNVELNREYVKDWVWEERKILPGDQVYITAKQARKEILYTRKNLDAIITDSPLALTTFYGDIYDKYERTHQACKSIVKQHHEIIKDLGYTAEHFFLIRKKKYNPSGRFQDEETAKSYDSKIKQFLEEYPINYTVVTCDDTCVQTIIDHLLKNDKKTI